jgi:hypothetical protein
VALEHCCPGRTVSLPRPSTAPEPELKGASPCPAVHKTKQERQVGPQNSKPGRRSPTLRGFTIWKDSRRPATTGQLLRYSFGARCVQCGQRAGAQPVGSGWGKRHLWEGGLEGWAGVSQATGGGCTPACSHQSSSS